MRIPLGRRELLEICNQIFFFAQPERRPLEGIRLSSRVSKVALDAHGAQENPADHDLRRIGNELVFYRPSHTRLGNDSVGRTPFQPQWLTSAIADGKAYALVDSICQQVYYPPAARIEINLDDVAFCVAEESRLVPLIRGRIVEARFRERQHRLHGTCLCGCRSCGDRESDRKRYRQDYVRARLLHLSSSSVRSGD